MSRYAQKYSKSNKLEFSRKVFFLSIEFSRKVFSLSFVEFSRKLTFMQIIIHEQKIIIFCQISKFIAISYDIFKLLRIKIAFLTIFQITFVKQIIMNEFNKKDFDLIIFLLSYTFRRR